MPKKHRYAYLSNEPFAAGRHEAQALPEAVIWEVGRGVGRRSVVIDGHRDHGHFGAASALRAELENAVSGTCWRWLATIASPPRPTPIALTRGRPAVEAGVAAAGLRHDRGRSAAVGPGPCAAQPTDAVGGDPGNLGRLPGPRADRRGGPRWPRRWSSCCSRRSWSCAATRAFPTTAACPPSSRGWGRPPAYCCSPGSTARFGCAAWP